MNSSEKETTLKTKKIELVGAMSSLADTIKNKSQNILNERNNSSKSEFDLASLANYKSQKTTEFNSFKNELKNILNDIDNIIKDTTK